MYFNVEVYYAFKRDNLKEEKTIYNFIIYIKIIISYMNIYKSKSFLYSIAPFD